MNITHNTVARRLRDRRCRTAALKELAGLPVTAKAGKCKWCGKAVFWGRTPNGGWMTIEPIVGPYTIIDKVAFRLTSGNGDWTRHGDICPALEDVALEEHDTEGGEA